MVVAESAATEGGRFAADSVGFDVIAFGDEHGGLLEGVRGGISVRKFLRFSGLAGGTAGRILKTGSLAARYGKERIGARVLAAKGVLVGDGGDAVAVGHRSAPVFGLNDKSCSVACWLACSFYL